MGVGTGIEWTDVSWPVVNGCRRKSKGCINCYSERLTATRLRHQPKYAGLAIYTEGGPRYTGKTRLWEPDLELPLRLSKPSRIFVANMGDLFYEKVPDKWIDRVFAVMALAQWHTFQVLTKRPDRAQSYLKHLTIERLFQLPYSAAPRTPGCTLHDLAVKTAKRRYQRGDASSVLLGELVLPLPHVWIGTSVEDQATADERLPVLLETPAALRFVSMEPLLEETSIWAYLKHPLREQSIAALGAPEMPGLDWVIVGGESGIGARPYDLAWARSIIGDCQRFGVPVFHKQIGANAHDSALQAEGKWAAIRTKSKKGGKMEEWSEDLRVREFPRTA